MRIRFLFFILLLFNSGNGFSGDEKAVKRFTVSGHVKDQSNGETLISATIYVKELATGTVTNEYGFFALSLPAGTYTLEISYLGYKNITRTIQLQQNLTVSFEMPPDIQEMQEVEITAEKKNKNIVNNEMSVDKLQSKQIKEIPALLGEVDVIKAIQLLPGVQTISEGSNGYSVRGGSSDQNLILLDEATVYNSSHLLGFFSVFNNDAVKDVTLYKGDIPAQYGGRLSSLLDIRMKEGNAKKFAGTGGIGTISSRLTLEGPILKDNTSFIVSGRRTYADKLFLPFARDETVRKNKLYFYDFNGKINHTIDENNRLYFSGYSGRDFYKNKWAEMGFGNRTLTGRWNHLFSKKLFNNLSLIYGRYDYSLGTPKGEANSFIWLSKMEDFTGKNDVVWYLNPANTIHFGYSVTYHKFDPGKAKGVGESSIFNELKLRKNYSYEHGIYAANNQKLTSKLTFKYGLRFSMFQNAGPGVEYRYNTDHTLADTIKYGNNVIFNEYFGFEPRAGLNYVLTDNASLKASYSRTIQYVHLAQNSTAGTPLDIWFPSSATVKPQFCDQYAAGIFRNFRDHTIETSIELYYKDMKNVIDFKDNANLLLNKYMEQELRFGTAYSYGSEFLIRKSSGDLSGWISYTLSKTRRKILEINGGREYPAPYDKPHNVSVVINYDFSKRVTVSSTFVYATGNPVTFPVGRAEYQGVFLKVYSDRNAYRMPDYHRMDLSLIIRGKTNSIKSWRGEHVISFYNVYNRHNAWSINFVQDENDPNVTYAEKSYIFPILPAYTYNFYF